MSVARTLLAVAGAAFAVAGCGGDVDPISGADAPAITSPGTTIPYESGGADGAGSDGRRTPDPRGGVAAGPDSGSGG